MYMERDVHGITLMQFSRTETLIAKKAFEHLAFEKSFASDEEIEPMHQLIAEWDTDRQPLMTIGVIDPMRVANVILEYSNAQKKHYLELIEEEGSDTVVLHPSLLMANEGMTVYQRISKQNARLNGARIMLSFQKSLSKLPTAEINN